MSLVIRECDRNDIQEVVRIENDSFDKPFPESLFRTFFSKFRKGFRVAESNGKLVGYSIIFPYKNHNSMVLMSLAVDSRFRRVKIGSALLQDSISLAANLGGTRVLLQVSKANDSAKDLYSRFGFVRIRDLPNYYGNGIDGIEMEVSLNCRTGKTHSNK